MNSDLLQGFYLGDLLVDPVKGQIFSRAGSAHLPPKAMEVLLCLASSPSMLVTREALLDDVWGKDQGSQEALSHAVSEIRHALDDHADNPEFVQTLPKRGYRLIVDAVPTNAGTSSLVLGSLYGSRSGDIGLLENLRQRGVLGTALAYLILGWLLIQIGDTVFGQLHLPPWIGTFVTVLVIAGFPIAVVLSWYLEIRDGRAVLHKLTPRDALRRRFSRTYISVLSSLAIAAVVVFIYDKSIGLPESQITVANTVIEESVLPPILGNTIAVLPFLNLDGSDDTQIFVNGLAEDLITHLSRVPGLLVSSRRDAFTLEPNSSSQKVRERLRVARYVEGSVQFEGDQMRIVVQLIDSSTGFHELSRSFDRPREEFFDVRDEITKLTVANLRVALPPNTRVASTSPVADPSIDVYILYRRGIDASREADIEGSVGEALKQFDAALAIDPEYAAAYAGKCDVFVDAYIFSGDTSDIDAAEASCQSAIDLNANLDVVYVSRGDLHTATGHYQEAELAYLKALEIYPNNALALIGLGKVYRMQQRPEEAEASIRQAAGLHPGDWAPYNALGTFLYRSGRYAEAAEQYRTLVALDNSNIRGLTNLGSALMLAGQFEEAEPVYDRALDLEPTAFTYSNLGMLLYNQRRFDEAVDAHRNAVSMVPQKYLARSNLGDALWAAGNLTEAIDVFGVAKGLALDALQVNPNDAFILMDLAWMRTVLGEHEEARKLIGRAMDLVPDDPYVHYIDGLMRNRRGDVTGSLDALDAAVDLGYPINLLAVDPNLSNINHESRFRDLLTPSN